MRRALTLALCLAAADAGLRIGKPSGAGALKMATREEEKKAKEERRAKRKAAMSKDPEQARKELKERLAGYSTGEARARKYMQIARTKKFGMSDEEFAKQQQTYGRVAMDEAQMEMRRRAEKARDAVETQRIKENRSRVFRRVTGRAAKATDPVDADPTLAPVAVAADGSVAAAPRSTRLSPAAKKVLKGSALAAAAAAVGKLVVAKIAERPAAAPPAPAPPAPAPAEPAVDAAEPDAPAEEAVAPAGADDDAAAAEDGAAAVPGMSPEAAARLAEAKLREELLGRVEGQYKLRGETCPLSVQKQTVAELEATLAELRGERE
ncbi:unnamed protein product [Pelagomonas calceolata]|uniref:Uncharacterized protein n=1 Tax=Pelagomonas calceolata TaxID=35677 RepID=A0A8J2SVE7_9STRA|nr:unnamed protein product [Pelagomonas calceolata]